MNNLPGIGDLFVTVRGGRTGAFGRLLGSGLHIVETRRRLAGVTLESADMISVLGWPFHSSKPAVSSDPMICRFCGTSSVSSARARLASCH